MTHALPAQPEGDPRLAAELEPGERLIWAGRPDTPRWFTHREEVLHFVVGTACTTFFVALFGGLLHAAWTGQMTSTLISKLYTSMFVTAMAIVFIGAGLMMIGQPLWNRWARPHDLYALTDRRCIIWRRTLAGRSTKSYAPALLIELSRTERRNGTGDLVLLPRVHDLTGKGKRTIRDAEAFLSIANVAQVEQLVRRTLLTHTRLDHTAPAPAQLTDQLTDP